MLWLGSVPAERVRSGQALPPSHSPYYHPEPEGTIKTGVTVLAAGVLELLPRRP
jgi:hypothetical protein